MTELIKAVSDINQVLYDQGFNDGEIELIYSTNSYVETVEFLGCVIFNSECHYWGEDSGFIDAEDLIRTRIKELINHIKDIEV